MHRSSQIVAINIIYIKDTWLTPDIELNTIEPPIHDPSAAPENANNTLTLSQSVPPVQESPASEVLSVSEVM